MNYSNYWDDDTLKQHIESLMLRLCIPTNLKGFHYLSCALYHAFPMQLYQMGIIHEIRTIVAEEYRTTVVNVERDIRTALRKISDSSRPNLWACEEQAHNRNITFKEFLILCVFKLNEEILFERRSLMFRS